MPPTFHYPFAGDHSVSSPYGPRNGGFHTGVDFNVPPGAEILASHDGMVIYAAYEAGGAGNTVTVRGTDGYQTRYHHMQRFIVGSNQPVVAGQVLGYCDSTGASSGPHLHFEIRTDPATHVDPLPYLKGSPPTPGDDEIVTREQMDTLGLWMKQQREIETKQILDTVGQWLKDVEGRLGAKIDAK
jgi:murein DD-endopeptidase MepM/ murein hydrolase activator NlpD